jgi:hypothetical protein
MARKESAARPARSLVRTFCPCRLAPTVLSQTYERLLPDWRRPLPRTPASSATASNAGRPTRQATLSS